jgi:Type IV secretion-system coupling protein DNA-binding domain
MQDDQKKQNDITYFGVTDARGKQVKFGIRKEDRLRHMYTIGKTGMGKSTLLENMAIQDIQNGEGMAFLDPHGKTAELLLEFVPEHRIKDVIYFAPFDLEHPVALNVLEDTAPGDESSQSIRSQFIVSGLMSTFKKIWKDQWSARMEYILNYTLLALLEIPEATLLDVNRMLSDKAFRKDVIERLKEPTVKAYWEKEFASMTDKMIAEAVPAIQNKVGQFISNALIRNIIGQTRSSFDFRKAMDERKIIIFNLSIGRIGEDAVNLLGSLFVTKIYLAAMSRADMSDREMKDVPNFYLYVDEFQNFINDSFAQILSQARKYKLGLIVAHQYVKQMTEIVHDAIFGNVGTMIAYRIGAEDADAFEKEFKPTFLPEDFTNIGRFQMYLKLMIDGVTSSAFSATGMGPWPEPEQSFVKEIIESSRALYSHPRKEVEDHILKWTLGGEKGGKSEGDQKQSREKPQPQQVQQTQTRVQTPRVERSENRQDIRQQPRSEPRREYRDERPRSEMAAPKPQPVHNPFKTAFKEIEPVPTITPPPVAEKTVDVKKVPEITYDDMKANVDNQKPPRKEIDEDTLKNVLGLKE